MVVRVRSGEIVIVTVGVRVLVVVPVRMGVIVFMAAAVFDKRRRHLISRLAINPGPARKPASAFHAHDLVHLERDHVEFSAPPHVKAWLFARRAPPDQIVGLEFRGARHAPEGARHELDDKPCLRGQGLATQHQEGVIQRLRDNAGHAPDTHPDLADAHRAG
jgi:hypothetical protein